MTVRQMTEADIPAIAEYEIEISKISFGEDAVTDPAFHQKKLRKAMDREGPGMLVLDEGGTIAGWLWMALKTNFVSEEKYINFKSFYLTAGDRGGEGSTLLMDAGMAFCKESGARYVVGKVHVKNLPMRALYKRYGFEPTHITMEYTAF